MSDFEQLFSSAFSGDTIRAIASSIGAPISSTTNAIAVALPALVGQLSVNASNADEGPKLDAAIDRDHDGSLLSDVNGFLGSGPLASMVGDKILGHVFGSQKRDTASEVAKGSGLDLAQAVQLLSILAPIVMAVLGRAKRQGPATATTASAPETSTASSGGVLSDILASIVGSTGATKTSGPDMGALGSVLGSILGGASSASGTAGGSPVSTAATKVATDVLGKILGNLGK